MFILDRLSNRFRLLSARDVPTPDGYAILCISHLAAFMRLTHAELEHEVAPQQPG